MLLHLLLGAVFGILLGAIHGVIRRLKVRRKIRPRPYVLEDVHHHGGHWYCNDCGKYIQRLFRTDGKGELRYVGMFCVHCGHQMDWNARKKDFLALEEDVLNYFDAIKAIEDEARAQVASDPETLRQEIADLEGQLHEKHVRLFEVETKKDIVGIVNRAIGDERVSGDAVGIAPVETDKVTTRG